MTTRRGRSHVRPRPPSTGRPEPVRVAAPDRRRVRQYRGLEARQRRAPLVTRLLLALSVLALGGAAFYVVQGGIGPVFSMLSAGFSGAFDRLIATPVPSPTEILPTDSPVIMGPSQPYTNQDTVELKISLPLEVVGDPTAKVRLYLALEGLEPAPVQDVPVGPTGQLVVPFQLTKGRNDISATVIHAGVESDFSPVVTWILDQDPPKISVTSPKDGATVNGQAVTLQGSTQAGTTLVAHNETSATSASTVAGPDGAFSITLPLSPGANAITISGTDPAGNTADKTLTVNQGTGKMTIHLSASTYRISVSHHPNSLQLTVLVRDPDGNPLAGATATFTLTLHGLAPISNTLTTGADGRAIFTTPLLGGLTVGNGGASVVVADSDYGQTTDYIPLTFVK
jgi:Glucodextranase, domain B